MDVSRASILLHPVDFIVVLDPVTFIGSSPQSMVTTSLSSLLSQVCGCFAALLRLVGTGIWNFSSLPPLEVLGMVEQRVKLSGGGDGASGRTGESGGVGDEAVHKKALEVLPLLVLSSFGVQLCAISPDRGRDGSDDLEDPSEGSLADAALEFITKEISRYRDPVTSERSQVGSSSLGGRGRSTRKRTALNQALFAVLEVCYGFPGSRMEDSEGNGDDAGKGREGPMATTSRQRLSGPEMWPWNADPGKFVENSRGRGSNQLRRLAYSSRWPLMSVKAWGPRLADAAADRDSYESVGGVVVEGAAAVIELVLRRHAGVAWSEALYALRVASSDRPKARGPGHRVMEKDGNRERSIPFIGVDSPLPLCEPLLERLCLELPVLDLPARVHSAVFEAHAWLALLPCGNFFSRRMLEEWKGELCFETFSRRTCYHGSCWSEV